MSLQHLDGVALVYFVQADSGLIKISATQRLSQRFATLQAENAGALTLLGVLPHVQADQHAKELRRKFRAQRTHAEWFRATPTLQQFIRDNVQPPETQVPAPTTVAPDYTSTLSKLPSLLTVYEVAQTFQLSRMTVRRYVHDGVIPYYRVGRQLRFDAHTVAVALRAHANGDAVTSA